MAFYAQDVAPPLRNLVMKRCWLDNSEEFRWLAIAMGKHDASMPPDPPPEEGGKRKKGKKGAEGADKKPAV